MGDMDGMLAGRVAVIVGVGASGEPLSNGRATAQEFARQGARLLLADRDPMALADCLAAVRAEGATAETVELDATDEAGVDAMYARCISCFGQVDVLQNNLGITSFGKVTNVTVADFDRLIAVNVRSVFMLCRGALKLMEPRGKGVITNISSISSVRHLGIRSPLYDLSKAAVNALTRNIAVDYGPRGIRANAVLVGMMDTPLARSGIAAAGRGTEEVYPTYTQRIPAGRMGEGMDTARLSAFLASDLAGYITGAEIPVDGGLIARAG